MHRLEHRAEARVGVGDPGEAAGRRCSPAEAGASSKARCARAPATARARRCPAQQRLDQQRQPLIGLAEDHRRLLAVEHSSRIASQRTASPYSAPSASALGVEVGDDVQLVERALPLAEHAEQLKQEDAQLGRRPGLALTAAVRCLQRRRGSPALEGGFGVGLGDRPWCSASCQSFVRRMGAAPMARSEAVAAVGAEARLARHRRAAAGAALVRARHVEAALVAEAPALRRRLAIGADGGGRRSTRQIPLLCADALGLRSHLTQRWVASS